MTCVGSTNLVARLPTEASPRSETSPGHGGDFLASLQKQARSPALHPRMMTKCTPKIPAHAPSHNREQSAVSMRVVARV